MRKLAAIALCAFAAAALAADLPAASPEGFEAKVDKTEVKLGEPFAYQIQVRHDAKEKYEFPKEWKPDPFEVAKPAECKRERAGASATTTCTVMLSLFDLDEHEIPEVALVAHTEHGDEELKVPGPKVKGLGIIDPNAKTDDLALRDIKPPAPVLVRSWKLLWIGLGVLGALAAGLLGWYLWKRRPKKGARAAPVVVLTPHERFEKRLKELQGEDLVGQARRREYAFRLSEIVREYLGGRYGLNALDLTTEELFTALRKTATPGLDHGRFRAWSERLDVVKYAKEEPTDADCADAMSYAWELWERTRPPPPAEAGKSAA